ncbi:MAG: manganese efflux pump [Tidjanibacter sp.]|nr:manganese efflux pump [Tidjanibacter sp.]
MDFLTLFLIAVGLSMDAFAVSICKGLTLGKTPLGKCAYVGMWFGGFQALMPIIGYFVGVSFRSSIERFDHWIAFALLALIGINMIRESLGKEEEAEGCTECDKKALSVRSMFPMAVATSIDALAVGVGFAFLSVDIWSSVICIGITTFALSAVGVKIGSLFGSRYKSKAELAGGIILICIGLKILLEHLFQS